MQIKNQINSSSICRQVQENALVVRVNIYKHISQNSMSVNLMCSKQNDWNRSFPQHNHSILRKVMTNALITIYKRIANTHSPIKQILSKIVGTEDDVVLQCLCRQCGCELQCPECTRIELISQTNCLSPISDDQLRM